jgi:hypothetical protein
LTRKRTRRGGKQVKESLEGEEHENKGNHLNIIDPLNNYLLSYPPISILFSKQWANTSYGDNEENKLKKRKEVN